jgi:eukaryotic-like serine/threonine-protein kinase
MIGQTLGHYRILEQIGSGGMGEVYRAHDDRLARDVAVKIVRSSTSNGQDRVRRFELEARAAAALNHPNIVAIYDVGVFDGYSYIVSELLEGQTLRERLNAGPLPIRLAADYGLQVAQGLAAAHEKHIVHRDLKPENLFITKDGRVKILDFGIAKLVSLEDEEGSVATMATQTKSGIVLGTVAYMSPDQLRGKAVDHRADIFSLGAILYEMLSGRRAFPGETSVDTITAILKEEPPLLTELRPELPSAFEPLVSHCLEKNPDNRFQSARDLAFALSALANSSTSKTVVAIRAIKSRSRRKLVLLTSIASLLAVAGVLLGFKLGAKAETPVYRRLTFEQGTVYSARFTPDGRNVIYGACWNSQPLKLYSTLADSPLERPLGVGDGYLLGVSRSNELALELHGINGERLAYVDGTLARTPLAGGAPREVLEHVRWADWGPTGELAAVYSTGAKILLEYPLGKVLYQSPGWISHIRVSPQGDRLAFLEHPAIWDDRGTVEVIDLAGHKTTLSAGWESEDGLAWSPRGDEVWFTAVEKGYNRRLMAVDLAGHLRNVLSVPGGLSLQDIAQDGQVLLTLDNERLVMEAAGAEGKETQDLSWYDWTLPKDISRDGQWVLFEESSEPAGQNYAVGIRKLDGSPPVRLGDGSSGGLSPDGRWALSIFTGKPERVTLLPIGPGQPKDVSLPGLENIQNGSAHFFPDGKRIVVIGNEPGHGPRTYIQNLDGGKPTPITPEGMLARLVSPDGRYVAGIGSDKKLFVFPVAGGTPREVPDLQTGHILIQWSQDSKSLYVYHGGELPAKIYKIDIATGKREFVRAITPSEHAGVVSVAPIVLSTDASRAVYSYYQRLSVLYNITGLH